MGNKIVVDIPAMNKLASDVESRAYNIETIPHPDVTAVVAEFMPESPLVAATSSATSDLDSALTVVSGQWETMASVVRATRSETERVDDESANKFRALGHLPDEPGK